MDAKVLIIEDNQQNRYLFSLLLKQAGCTVFEAKDGQSGLEMTRDIKPDIILLDIQLPDIDGYQVATALRKMTAFSEVPIVAVTSYAMVGDRDKAISAGCSGYIEKPINPRTFIEDVARYWEASTVRDSDS